ncbi:MAG TPA: ABC transporter ATP-binding protein [Longilinea sp.]|nr:ABC transporter ATP-binding protein [Longilinea sp.]
MNIVRTEGLTKTYGSGSTAVTALEHVSVSIGSGEFVAVMGPSGCGKSTLLHLVGGLDRPTEGKVFLEGQDIYAMKDDQLTELRRRKIGFIFQFFNLLPMLTAAENTALPLILDGVSPAVARGQAGEWLERLNLGDRLDHHPDQLSGGQQQRVAIARALTSEPSLILADEPTGNLDSHASDEIASLLRKVADEWERSIFMVTHDPRIAAYADRIIFLKDGKMVEDAQLNGATAKDVKLVKAKAEAL